MYTTPLTSPGSSIFSSFLTRQTTLSRPYNPVKNPCSKTTFCRALYLKSGSCTALPSSSGVYKIIPKPIFLSFICFSNFSIIVRLPSCCSRRTKGSIPKEYRKVFTSDNKWSSCPWTIKTFVKSTLSWLDWVELWIVDLLPFDVVLGF